MKGNKIHYDLTNVHVAKQTTAEDGTIDWATPKRLAGAISVDFSAEGDAIKLRADGVDYYVSYSNNGYAGDLNMAMVPDWYREEILGEALDDTDKVLLENAHVEPSPFALLFEFFGDVARRKHVLYNCVSSRPSLAGENKDSQKEPDTESLAITATPLEDGSVKASTTDATPAAVAAAWFTKVWVKTDLQEGG